MNTLGERIRTIRKQKKLTLEQLAGEKLTKGMLSLIENNKANPSMESLAYIAGQLGVEMTELLEEISVQELRDVLEQAEKLFNVDIEKKADEDEQIIALVTPYVEKLTQGYEAARLLDIYSKCLFRNKQTGWKEYSDRAANMYEKMNIISKRANIGLFRASVKYTEHQYGQALDILLRERAEVESNHAFIDPITRVDFDYHEATLHFAVGDSISAIRVMEEAIEYSKKHRIFYRIDDLYRLAAFEAMMSKNEQKLFFYQEKLKQYGQFADDTHSLLFYDLMNIELLNLEGKFGQALEKIEGILTRRSLDKIYRPYFFIGKGIALYGLSQFEQSLHWLDQVKIPSYMHHPFDLSVFYVTDSYKALCHLKLGNHVEALTFAKLAVKNIDPLPHTPYKDFIYEINERIQKECSL
ncbi:helix-turn-helix transcriptional regulator [Bacillus sp. FJAT-50079]|uniref:helix-turn-helix domain-containing protein n=1 Tax=Bacillus sp. FJAT-50079 TaxID=2833577 RepID=UPI001BC9E266|nr:helix-turn-helix transcriptional regulator [Bacillus sp. FJAT-50079]MBS4210399.1 helix-turn-helix transcriptional regulator [Bacillus sp. FJAT-50079]